MKAWGLLSDQQALVSRRALEEESSRTAHIAVALSGAHAYGFPSPDSDVDLKAVHVAPTARLLGLRPALPPLSRMEVLDGVEIDYTSNEIGAVLAGVLKGNGNYLERILGQCLLQGSPWLEELRTCVVPTLSRRVHQHYRGFAHRQRIELDARPSAKRVLYVLRTALTGTHLLRTGEVVTDLTTLLDPYGFRRGHELVEIKRQGETTRLSSDVLESWRSELDRAFKALDDAAVASILPLEPSGVDALENWLVELRKERMAD